jgi:hypothetical protein
MSYKGFKAKIMRAQRLTGTGVHGLPPGTGIEVFPVDAFEEPLSHWIKGSGNYVVPVDADWGLWFDFTMNDQMNTAVLLSIKGMNPVTGQRTNGFGLERYQEKCPIHGENFKDGLFCEKCNYKWPEQNYIAYPNTLWWDGFRSSDGKVRQFFFTEDLEKSIPELVIGKEDTIPAFGFAFFKPKITRESIKQIARGFSGSNYYTYSSGNIGIGVESPTQKLDIQHIYLSNSSPVCCDSFQDQSVNYCSTLGETKYSNSLGKLSSFQSSSLKTMSLRSAKRINQEVGVGAGAEISQSLTVDPLKVSDWEDEPSSIMRLYFVFVEQFEDIKKKGMKDLTGQKEGFLSGLPVG